jgi:hypothetical protein
MVLARDSKDFCNCDMQDLINKNNFEHGVDLSISGVGAAFFFAATYDFAKPYDKQNIARFEANNGRIVINLGVNVGLIASGQLNVYGIFRKGVEKYLRKWFSFNQNQGGVGTQLSIPLRVANVTSIYCRTGSDFQNINILKDDYPVMFGSGQSFVASTMRNGRIEAAITFINEELNSTEEAAEITSDALQLNLTSNTAGGVTVIMYEVIEFDANKTAVSYASYVKFATTKLVKNKPAVNVQQILTGKPTGIVTKTMTNSQL